VARAGDGQLRDLPSIPSKRALRPSGVNPRSGTERRLPGFDRPTLEVLSLTRREVAVLELVAQGHTNERIAASLDLSPLTVKKHLQRMSAKLGATNRAGLVGAAWQRSRPVHQSRGQRLRPAR
jgi:DNA-binding CsgD family transcriptional regulator